MEFDKTISLVEGQIEEVQIEEGERQNVPLKSQRQSWRHICLLLISIFLIGFCFSVGKVNHVWAQDSEEKGGPSRLFTADQMKTIETNATTANSSGWRKNMGPFFSITKIVLFLIVFWLWVATSGWANCDAERLGDEERLKWNTILVAVFPTAFLIGFLVPIFWVGYPVTVLGFMIPIFCYISHRNNGKLEADKVMTPGHIWFVVRRTCGAKIKKQKQAYELGSPIYFKAGGKGLDKDILNGRTILARNNPGYVFFKEIAYVAIKRNATAIGLEFIDEELKIQYEIDGVWHSIEEGIFRKPLSPEEVESMAVAIKTLVGANPEDHRSRQAGLFSIEYDRKKKLDADFMSQGTKSGGEQFIIHFILKKITFTTLEQLGMLPSEQTEFKTMINADKGLVLLAAQSGQGLKTMTDVAFNVADRFTRDFVTVEDLQHPYLVIENVTLTAYDSSKKQSPIDVLPDVFFKEPKVLLIRDLINKETLSLCCEEVKNDRLIISTFRGKDAAETLMQVLRTGINPQLVAETLYGIVAQRLVRRLCPSCKEEIPVSPQLLVRLGMEPDAVETIFRKRIRPELEPGEKDTYVPCEDCHEIGYIGRCGVYDMLLINDEIRHIITANPSAEAIRKAAIAAGQKGFMAHGGELVAEGITSVEELQRIMK